MENLSLLRCNYCKKVGHKKFKCRKLNSKINKLNKIDLNQAIPSQIITEELINFFYKINQM